MFIIQIFWLQNSAKKNTLGERLYYKQIIDFRLVSVNIESEVLVDFRYCSMRSVYNELRKRETVRDTPRVQQVVCVWIRKKGNEPIDSNSNMTSWNICTATKKARKSVFVYSILIMMRFRFWVCEHTWFRICWLWVIACICYSFSSTFRGVSQFKRTTCSHIKYHAAGCFILQHFSVPRFDCIGPGAQLWYTVLCFVLVHIASFEFVPALCCLGQ